jgi:hypothetical protein
MLYSMMMLGLTKVSNATTLTKYIFSKEKDCSLE